MLIGQTFKVLLVFFVVFLSFKPPQVPANPLNLWTRSKIRSKDHKNHMHMIGEDEERGGERGGRGIEERIKRK